MAGSTGVEIMFNRKTFSVFESDGPITKFIDRYSEALEEKAYEDTELKSRFCPNSTFEVRCESGNPLERDRLIRTYKNGNLTIYPF
jgi:hypothetical protein